MLRLCNLTCVFTISAIVAMAQAVPALPAVQTTGMVGIADAQTAQLNLLNIGVAPPAVGVICTAAVSFVDANGTVLKSTTLTVPPGTSKSFTLRSDVDLNLIAGDRREIRITIATPLVPPPTATTAVAPACHFLPTLEMLDTVSGRTLVVLGHLETIPSVTATP
jgi:hypothetical protein